MFFFLMECNTRIQFSIVAHHKLQCLFATEYICIDFNRSLSLSCSRSLSKIEGLLVECRAAVQLIFWWIVIGGHTAAKGLANSQNVDMEVD